MVLKIEKATKFKIPAKVLIWGTEKSGKTHSALGLATALAEREGEEVLVGVVNSEPTSSSQLLQPTFPHDMVNLVEYDRHGQLVPGCYTPQRYEEAIKLFLKNGYKAIVIDSISHCWQEVLNMVQARGGNTFNDGWGQNSPIYDHLVNTILSARCHIIVTCRGKEEYKQEEYTKKNGDKGFAPVNIGQAPIMRKNFGFEMHLKIRMHDMVAKVEATAMQRYIPKFEEIAECGPDLADRILKALDGAPLPEPSEQQKEISSLLNELNELYGVTAATYTKIPDWDQKTIRKALELGPVEPLPLDYTEEQVELMRIFVSTKKFERQRKQEAQVS